jgi:asparagine synthetase B (glutamine-hydrolysing)
MDAVSIDAVGADAVDVAHGRGCSTVQINMSPYLGRPDFSGLGKRTGPRRIDLVSVADLLRNSVVYAPHSSLQDIKLVPYGFSPDHDMADSPQFRFEFRHAEKGGEFDGKEKDWVGTYHRLLCDAISRSCADMRAPWLLQSGGKDSTTLAIAIAEARPDTTCITYLGGREENEVASARFVAETLGLRHEQLVCDPGRAYDRYLDIVGRMPLLCADFAVVSFVDLATESGDRGGEGVIDGLGSDTYFGAPVKLKQRLLFWLARGFKLPPFVFELPWIGTSFQLCYALSTLQMDPVERVFPGSRFSDAEVDELFGRPIAHLSRERLSLFKGELSSATSLDEWRDISLSIAGAAGGFAKGLYTADALSLQAAFPFCDRTLREWIYRQIPTSKMVDPVSKINKVLVRNHIATRFEALPYVAKKGSFRFDLCGLALQRFDQVHAYARQSADVLPGAARWLERNRRLMGNKYHASKFYLLAIVLPWICEQEKKANRT